MASLENQKFGKLTVVSYIYTKNRNKYWNCVCECGNNTIVPTASLKRKKRSTKSCGCLQRHLTRISKGRIKYSKGEACCWSLYLSYKRNSKKRNIDFKLFYDFFKKITKKKCHYCNVKPNQKHTIEGTNGSYIYNGIDRINSNIGYLELNSKPCCKDCNYAKRLMSEKEFYNWIKRVYNHIGSA